MTCLLSSKACDLLLIVQFLLFLYIWHCCQGIKFIKFSFLIFTSKDVFPTRQYATCFGDRFLGNDPSFLGHHSLCLWSIYCTWICWHQQWKTGVHGVPYSSDHPWDFQYSVSLVPLSEIQMLESQLLKHLPVCKGIVQQCTTTPY